VVDRDQSTIERVLAEIGTEGGTAYGLATDFMTEPGIRQIADACASRWDRLDILFNGHAAMDFWEFGEETADDWVTILSVNVIAPAMTTKAALPLLKKSRAGSVIFLGSIDGFRGMPENPGYSASKGALIPLAHCLAHTHGPDGIRFNYMATAAILHTGPNDLQRKSWFAEGAMEAANARTMGATPLGRACRPEDVASVALFLASDDSAYVTGTAITVDGGRTAYTPMLYQQ
jgi:NAD(P)-dependent dehydrogenase (short-subunit alcohol dehydrogenase family)